jgi:hypothetical protein
MHALEEIDWLWAVKGWVEGMLEFFRERNELAARNVGP